MVVSPGSRLATKMKDAANARQVRCTKCGHVGRYDSFPKGRDFFQHLYIARCANPECDNRQSPGGASMRMFPGADHPFEFVRDMDWTVESVRGTVIGSDNAPRYRYQFFTKGGLRVHYDWVHFDSDAEAEEWFKQEYPEHYRRGVEMRAWTN